MKKHTTPPKIVVHCVCSNNKHSNIPKIWCKTIQNFYYCRLTTNGGKKIKGVKPYKISTIVDHEALDCTFIVGVKPYKISTIVDPEARTQGDVPGVKPYKISTIVDV